MNPHQILISGLVAAAAASAVSAQTIISSNFATSTTLTLANSPYQLQGDIYVLPGATLTIQAGVQFRSAANSTLAVTRGAQIIANGTKDAPIVFTSSADTGVYRQLANNEWGNLTIMGSGYISEDEIPSNSAAPSATNYADMEGLTPANPALNDYGGGNDNDDSGSLSYCGFRYGGIASIPGKELNGLSLGGVGRNTDIHHIEILNNIDDGIEIWGGTVNLKYISIWNIGDDSLDIDQGWRGKAQFGLIVQGLSNAGAQGSGFGDNAMEIDGAERCDWQPVTTCALHNWTVIGGENNAAGGAPTDELVEFRDNARVQFLNCIFMDAGKEVVNDAVTDGEANNNTTVCGPGSLVPQMLARMTTSASTTYSVNPFAGAGAAAAYTAQDASGNLVQFRGCVYYNNDAANAYPEAISYGIFPQIQTVGGVNHANNTIEMTMPITARTRGAAVVATGHAVNPITFLDPTPAGVALTAAEVSPNDGFFTQARYVGGFARGNNWLIGWTGTSQYGLTTQRGAGSNEPIHGIEKSGVNGVPVLYTVGNWAPSTSVTLGLDNLQNLGGVTFGLILFSTLPANPVAGQASSGVPVGFLGLGFDTLVPSSTSGVACVVNGLPGGSAEFTLTMPPASFAGQNWYSQGFGFDTGLPLFQFTSSNAQRHSL